MDEATNTQSFHVFAEDIPKLYCDRFSVSTTKSSKNGWHIRTVWGIRFSTMWSVLWLYQYKQLFCPFTFNGQYRYTKEVLGHKQWRSNACSLITTCLCPFVSFFPSFDNRTLCMFSIGSGDVRGRITLWIYLWDHHCSLKFCMVSSIFLRPQHTKFAKIWLPNTVFNFYGWCLSQVATIPEKDCSSFKWWRGSLWKEAKSYRKGYLSLVSCLAGAYCPIYCRKLSIVQRRDCLQQLNSRRIEPNSY